MKMTLSEKQAIADRLGISPEAFAAYRKSEAAKRKAMRAMSADERRAFEQAEADDRKRAAAKSYAARVKRDGLELRATRIGEDK